jgi:hypothetical protein
LGTKGPVPLVLKMRVLSLNETGLDRTIRLEQQARSLLSIVALVKDAAKHDDLQRQAPEVCANENAGRRPAPVNGRPKQLRGAGKIKFDHLDKTKDLAATKPQLK